MAMNFEQAAILLLLAAMLAIFALDRIRMEVVALGGLGIALGLGLVAPAAAFSGLSNPAFVTVVEILLIVQVLGRSGVLDPLARRIPDIARSEARALAVLCIATASLSVFMNNIGALALMIPIAASVCRVAGINQRRVLMPISFAALLGGLCSVIGTPANLIVSNQLAAATGRGFAFFDFSWVGLPAAIIGIVAIVIWTRRILAPAAESETNAPAQASLLVVTEVEIGPSSPLAGRPYAELDPTVHAVRRGGANLMFQRAETRVEPGDTVLLTVDLPLLESWLAAGTAHLPASHGGHAERVEAVILPESTLVGSRIATLEGLTSRGIHVIAVATRTTRIEGSFADLRLSIGDVVYLSGERQAIAEAVEEAEILPLWPRPIEVALNWRPVILFAAGIALAAFGLAPTELAFGLVIFALAATGDLNLRNALGDLNWPILIMLAAMIPLGLAVETTGAAGVMAGGLIAALPSGHPTLAAAAMLALALVITPFVNNATTAIILGPIAVSIASALGMRPEPLLIAVALGASVDFLTPIGHHNNTVVMGMAGYRFMDFLKAGSVITIAIAIVSILAIRLAWL